MVRRLTSSVSAAGAVLAAPVQSLLMFEQDTATGQLQVGARAAVSETLFSRQYHSQMSVPRSSEGIAACDALNECDPKTHTCIAEVKNDQQNFKMKVYENDQYISRMALCQHQTWEYGNVRYLLQDLQTQCPSCTGWGFLDVGANIGSWTLPTALEMKGKGGKLVAVEADPQTIGVLMESVNMNGLQDQVNLVQKAIVQDHKAVPSVCLTMGDAAESGNVGANEANLGERDGKADCKKMVQTLSLDALYETNPSMKHMIAAKLDCEGCEGQAIMGGSKFLSEAPPCFLAFEATERYLCESKTPLPQLKDFLEKHGYDASEIAVHGGNTCEEYNAWETTHPVSQEFYTLQRHDMAGCLKRFQSNQL